MHSRPSRKKSAKFPTGCYLRPFDSQTTARRFADARCICILIRGRNGENNRLAAGATPPFSCSALAFSASRKCPLPFPLLAPAMQAIWAPGYWGEVKTAGKKGMSPMYNIPLPSISWQNNLGQKWTYRKIPIISPRLIFVQKGFFCWAYFRGSLFLEGLIIGRNFAFQNGLGLTIKTA